MLGCGVTSQHRVEAAATPEQLFTTESANRCIKQFDHVERRHFLVTEAPQSAHKLQQTTRICADHRFGAGGKQVLHFAVAEFVGGLRTVSYTHLTLPTIY